MTITTIYNPGDTVWLLSNNKIVQTTILNDVPTVLTGKDGDPLEKRIQWRLDFRELMWAGIETQAIRSESELFRTKEELIAHLQRS